MNTIKNYFIIALLFSFHSFSYARCSTLTEVQKIHENDMFLHKKTNKMGKIDWSSVLESTCLNDYRNEMIINLVKYFPERIFLVLCKRVEQAKYLERRLKEEKEDVTSLIGSNQEYDKKSRILIGTVGKCSVGFDHAKLDTMILASDVQQYFEQYIGRIMRTQDGEPIIFDIVDKYPLLEKHFRSRSAVYTEMGGIVKDFRKCFPDFEICIKR